MMKKLILLTLFITAYSHAEDSATIDDISVTATKTARATKDVPQSISVVNSRALEAKNVFNISDAIDSVPGVQISSANGGYDAKLVIRGSGLKAPYGIRENMVLRDGVPMTDPDSFTRMDFIDIQDIERIEVSKGPGSIYNSNTTGGVVQIISKSVFDEYANRVKLGLGGDGKVNTNVRYGFKVGDKDYVALSGSYRNIDNDWRPHNKFDTTQLSLKYGHLFANTGKLESELAYTEANLDIPPTLNKTEYASYLDTGKSIATATQWQNSGRYSKIWFFNTRYTQQFGNLSVKPRVYATKWEHFHPVTGMINDSKDNRVVGADLEFNHKHRLLGNDAELTFGLTARDDTTNNARKYTYQDVETANGRMIRTLSDQMGALASTSDSSSTLYGVYAQESFKPIPKLLVDVGARFEKLNMDMSGNEMISYDYRRGNYGAGDGRYDYSTSYSLFSPKIGASYRYNDKVNVYASIAQGVQAPTSKEFSANQALGNTNDLKAAKSTNYEVGVKARSGKLHLDAAVYTTKTRDEVVSRRVENQTLYENAGKTTKNGFEVALTYPLNDYLNVGANYAYSDYRYDDYFSGREDYSGKQFKYIPKNMYSLSLDFKHPNGFMAQVQSRTWGSYFMDDANTSTYAGYKLVTDLMLGYQHQEHSVQLNANNVFDKRYATVAEKGRFSESYKAAQPRNLTLSYRYEF